MPPHTAVLKHQKNGWPHHVLLLVLALSFLSSCVSRAPKPTSPIAETLPVKPVEPPPATPTPPLTVQTPPSEIPRKPIERPRITLVMGGAGVASFAAVGLFKRFSEEGVEIDLVVSTGWPTLFALGYGFSRSVHDLEWFAMRLNEKDFYAAGLFEMNRGYASHEKLSSMIEKAFAQKDLSESRVPLVISACNIEPGDPEVFDRGDWRAPLLKTMSIPGIYRPYPQNNDAGGVPSLTGIDVDEAVRRGAKTIVAVHMYDDYFHSFKGSKQDNSDGVFRRLYLSQLKNSIAKEFKLAQVTGKIHLGKAPGDFTAKRSAIQAGYKEGARIMRELRRESNSR